MAPLDDEPASASAPVTVADPMGPPQRGVQSELEKIVRMRRVETAVAAVLASVGLMLMPSTGKADIYRYVDAKGVIHFSNIPRGPGAQNAKRMVAESKKTGRSVYLGYRTGIWSADFYRKVSSAELKRRRALYEPLINQAALAQGLDPNLVKAVAHIESGFNSMARSPAGAMGIMQLMPGTADLVDVANAWDPADNINGGCRYLKQMLERFKGDVRLALAAYNAGPENVEKYGGIPPFQETQQYVRSVAYQHRVYTTESLSAAPETRVASR